MKQFFGKKSRSALAMVLMASLLIHLVGILVFGTIKFVSEVLREETVFEAAPIEPPPQKEREYTVNLPQRNKSTPPPRPPAIVVNNPSELDIPALDIDLNVDTSAVYGRGGGGFGGGGLAGLREMSMDINFFGSTFSGDANRMFFVIDMSGSMIMGSRGPEGYKNVVDELVETLRKTNNKGAFNIIAFSGKVETFKSSFTSVSAQSIEEARQWLMERDPAATVKSTNPSARSFPPRHRGTSSGKALQVAFRKRPGVIFFLSDGSPTDMQPAQIYTMVEELQELQGGQKVPINTISYKTSSGFMKTLAEQNEGKYTQVQ